MIFATRCSPRVQRFLIRDLLEQSYFRHHIWSVRHLQSKAGGWLSACIAECMTTINKIYILHTIIIKTRQLWHNNNNYYNCNRLQTCLLRPNMVQITSREYG